MSEREVLVSVIMPIYNQEKYIDESLGSVQRQTLQDIEIICIDDGSKDATPEMLDSYAAADERIRVIHKANSGYGHTMNMGLDACSGKYVAIVEPDDFISENMLEDLYQLAEKYETDFVKSDFALLEGEAGAYRIEPVKIYGDDSLYGKVLNEEEKRILLKGYLAFWSSLYRRSFIEKHHIRFHETPGASYQDTGFWFQTIALAERVYLSPKYYYHYRQDNPNASMKSNAKVYVLSQEYDWIEERLKEHGIFESYLPQYVMSRFAGARDTVTRLADDYRLEFLWHTAGVFRQMDREGMLDTSFMWAADKEKLCKLMTSPEKYYEDISAWPKLLHELTKPYEKFYIYGAGQRGGAIYQALSREDQERCLGFLVTDEREAGRFFFGKLVQCLEYVTLGEKNGILLGVTEKYQEEMLAELERRQIKNVIVLPGQGEALASMPQISVIVPVYNVEKYLEACLFSLVTQDERDIEIICINDGSTDSSGEILKSWADRDSRIRVIEKQNSGLAAARNSGLANARGRYLCFVDSDDMLLPGSLKKLSEAAENSGADIVSYETAPLLFEDIRKRDYRTEEYYEVKGSYSGLRSGRSYFCDMMENNDFVESANLLFIKSQWLRDSGLQFEPGRYYEDAVFSLQCHLRCEKMLHIKERLYCYRIRANSTMTSKADYKRAMDRMWVMQECLKAIYTQAANKREQGNIAKFACMTMWNLKLICEQMPAEDRQKLSTFPFNSIEGLLINSMELTRTPVAAEPQQHDRDRLKHFLEDARESKKIILYGAGLIGSKVHALLNREGLAGKIAGFAVTGTPQKKQKEGLTVQEISRYARLAKRKGTLLIVSANQDNQPDMINTATKIGFRDVRTVDYFLECEIEKYI